MKHYPTPGHKSLFAAILNIKGDDEIAMFIRDLLTISEINAASERWHIARLLWTSRLSYKEISHKTGASTTTVTRVAHWLDQGSGGYQLILTRLYGARKR